MNNLVKSFEVGKNVLDGLTFQVDQGERVGLLGRNGAGKTTLFKILTGELDYDEGTVVVGQGRRVGLISQIPVYPAGCTVEDVLRSAFARLESLADEKSQKNSPHFSGNLSCVHDSFLCQTYEGKKRRFLYLLFKQ